MQLVHSSDRNYLHSNFYLSIIMDA